MMVESDLELARRSGHWSMPGCKSIEWRSGRAAA